MKPVARLVGVIVMVLLTTLLYLPQAQAQNGQDECTSIGGQFFDKLDNIPDLEAGEEYTGTTGGGYTVTVRFDGPHAYTLVSSGLPAGSYLYVAKFGVGGGFSHLTFCTTVTENPVVEEPPVVENPVVEEPPVVENPVVEKPAVVENPVVVEAPAVNEAPVATTVKTAPVETARVTTDSTTPGMAEPATAQVMSLPSTGQGPDMSESDGGLSGLMLASATSASMLFGAGTVIALQQRSRSQH